MSRRIGPLDMIEHHTGNIADTQKEATAALKAITAELRARRIAEIDAHLFRVRAAKRRKQEANGE